jgi:hypothetical protein
MVRPFLLGLLALISGASVLAQGLTVRIHVVAAAHQDAPVQVSKLILWPDYPEPHNPTIIGVVLENASKKLVVSVDLTSVTQAPPDCITRPTRRFVIGSNSDPRSLYIEPGTTVQSWTSVAEPNHAVSASLWLTSRFVQVQIGVARVEFADGSYWQWSESGVFEAPLRLADNRECSVWQWPDALNSMIAHWNNSQTGRLQGIGNVHLFIPGRTTAGFPTDGRATDDEARPNKEAASFFYDCSLELNADRASCGPPKLSDETKQTTAEARSQ